MAPLIKSVICYEVPGHASADRGPDHHQPGDPVTGRERGAQRKSASGRRAGAPASQAGPGRSRREGRPDAAT
jgi:hypothetical protein